MEPKDKQFGGALSGYDPAPKTRLSDTTNKPVAHERQRVIFNCVLLMWALIAAPICAVIAVIAMVFSLSTVG